MPEGGEILAMTSLPTEGHGFNRDARSHFGDDRRAPPPEGARMGLIESSHRLIDPFFWVWSASVCINRIKFWAWAKTRAPSEHPRQ